MSMHTITKDNDTNHQRHCPIAELSRAYLLIRPVILRGLRVSVVNPLPHQRIDSKTPFATLRPA